ncbi:hypothetical protein F8M41_002023 [Gigaspora margarita]|uniref:F-box domain-containing protein n=1 Tax=Gigaspora margarita TaxID=4874 RepID=A0A8H4ESI4_GIGMA|nr:hypothetical protein F8M41_002023 [Gigaspora margarita]
MTTLSNESYYIIFDNFRLDFKNLFSFALVNRHWCRIIIPILWSEPYHKFRDLRLIRRLFLTLNVEEQTLLNSFIITLPYHQESPLFDYTSYIKYVSNDFYDGVNNWLSYTGCKVGHELKKAVNCSLIAMFLRTCKNLKHLSLDETICNRTIFQNLCVNTTITSIDLYMSSLELKDGKQY